MPTSTAAAPSPGNTTNPISPAAERPTPLVRLGDHCSRSVRFSRDDIANFARLSGNSNPLHHDQQAAQRARHGEIIASGEHITALMIGTVSSHFSQPDASGPRELLCLNFNFAFKAPVFAEQAIELSWKVASVEPHARLGGLLVQMDGKAAVRHASPAVVGRGTLLIKTVVV